MAVPQTNTAPGQQPASAPRRGRVSAPSGNSSRYAERPGSRNRARSIALPSGTGSITVQSQGTARRIELLQPLPPASAPVPNTDIQPQTDKRNNATRIALSQQAAGQAKSEALLAEQQAYSQALQGQMQAARVTGLAASQSILDQQRAQSLAILNQGRTDQAAEMQKRQLLGQLNALRGQINSLSRQINKLLRAPVKGLPIMSSGFYVLAFLVAGTQDLFLDWIGTIATAIPPIGLAFEFITTVCLGFLIWLFTTLAYPRKIFRKSGTITATTAFEAIPVINLLPFSMATVFFNWWLDNSDAKERNEKKRNKEVEALKKRLALLVRRERDLAKQSARILSA